MANEIMGSYLIDSMLLWIGFFALVGLLLLLDAPAQK